MREPTMEEWEVPVTWDWPDYRALLGRPFDYELDAPEVMGDA